MTLRNDHNERGEYLVPMRRSQLIAIKQTLEGFHALDSVFGENADRDFARGELRQLRSDYKEAEANNGNGIPLAAYAGEAFLDAMAQRPGFRIVDGYLRYSSAWLNDEVAS